MTVFWRSGYAVGHVLRLDDGREKRMEAGTPPTPHATLPPLSVSVVICTRDRPDELRRCLASLPQQSVTPAEIVVVDNASRDGRTREVALEAGVVYVREDRPGLDFARNTGALRATADIIAYTDDDVLLHPQWLEHLLAAFDEPSIGAVTGLVLPGELETAAQRHFESYWSFGQGYDRIDFRAADFAATSAQVVFPAWKVGAGASMAFRRDVFDRVGYFDERLDVGQAGCSGDSEYWYRLLAAGIDCRYEPTAIAFHFHRRAMEGLSHQIYSYMRGHAAALMVQNERTGLRCNLRQALWRMPRWYAGRIWRRLRQGRTIEDRFLKQEVTGYFAGLLFYWRQKRPHG
ncbi:glycosyltransferase family 2 protein [Sphingobium estronivorans]|uniref:glycosyltransferase family 2 protein n=1 Tax=Sphingobium estronivorans TaxID=1577690 RepID=UPI001239A5F0|nr:glycosyltransferase [Sphingobium estronivorans]